MKKKAFNSGSVLGMEKEQRYREIIAKICFKLGFDVIDPWRRERTLYKGNEECWWTKVSAHSFVKRDLDGG